MFRWLYICSHRSDERRLSRTLFCSSVSSANGHVDAREKYRSILADYLLFDVLVTRKHPSPRSLLQCRGRAGRHLIVFRFVRSQTTLGEGVAEHAAREEDQEDDQRDAHANVGRDDVEENEAARFPEAIVREGSFVLLGEEYSVEGIDLRLPHSIRNAPCASDDK